MPLRLRAFPPSPAPAGRGLADRHGILEEGSDLSDARLEEVPLDGIEDNPFQPRQRIEPTELNALADSIRHLGIIEPLVGRPHPTKEGTIQLAAGARRRAAARMAGLSRVPVIVRDLDDKAMRLFGLAENIHRLGLRDAEREKAYHDLWNEVYRPLQRRAPGDKHLDLMAKELGLNRVTVGDVLRAYEARKALGEGAPELSTQDASVLAPLAREDPASARTLAEARGRGRLTADALAGLAPRLRALPPEQRTETLSSLVAGRPKRRGPATLPPRPVGAVAPGDPALRQLGQLLLAVRAFAAATGREAYRDEEEREQAIEILLEIQRLLGEQLELLMQDAPQEARKA